ncbi:GNAT family N-acetyltransferase [Kineococcus rubinsiae]|uniref:GNAT family N-acetyltransferase n=1 Tax=Kineococcus rubinsiae TaxID=2609562 RepID=UPI001FCB447F|nr:GNAT family protein [Kineococcus rubinsiae]
MSIRRATAEDEDSMWVYRRLDDVSQWGSWGPVDQEDWRTILAPRLRDVLVIELDGRIVGDFMVKVVAGWAQREIRDHARGVQAELSWALDPGVGGHGYATEALREVLRMCFEDLHVRRVVANAFAANEASCRLAERVGMRRVLYAPAELLHRDLGWLDGVGYALLAQEWSATR